MYISRRRITIDSIAKKEISFHSIRRLVTDTQVERAQSETTSDPLLILPHVDPFAKRFQQGVECASPYMVMLSLLKSSSTSHRLRVR